VFIFWLAKHQRKNSIFHDQKLFTVERGANHCSKEKSNLLKKDTSYRSGTRRNTRVSLRRAWPYRATMAVHAAFYVNTLELFPLLPLLHTSSPPAHKLSSYLDLLQEEGNNRK
jgi:hypothetical protein